ncbi:hypothetical protein [Amycolatopsis sp. NBRC 101858]|uniref:hypothetical protein n=1 Tax=Amycolatopsis sp. NBRC 101858 TaxID=3032200 RepID=UPI0025540C79|nr:hypothetical protein [Amycolatopsis sp. NBRC 101858]
MSTVPAVTLREGDWFWHEPWPGYRAGLLQAVSIELGESTVQITTTDCERALVDYSHDRPLHLADAPPATEAATLTGAGEATT